MKKVNVLDYAKVKKGIAATCIAVFATVNTSSVVLAAVPQKNIASTAISKSLQGSSNENKTTKKQMQNNNFIVAKTMEEARGKVVDKKILKAPQAAPKAEVGQKAKAGQKYTLTQLKNMSYEQMVDAIASTTWDGITGLFVESDESKAFFNDTSRLNYIISDLGTRGSQFTTTDDKGIPTIVEVIRAASYLQYNNPTAFSGVDSDALNSASIQAMKKIMNNSNLGYGTLVQDTMVYEIGMLLGNTSCDGELATLIANKIIKPFRNNIDKYGAEKNKYNALSKVMSSMEYVYSTEKYYNKDKQPGQYPSYGKINDYIDELFALACTKVTHEGDKWLPECGVYYGIRVDMFHNNKTKILRELTDAMHAIDKYTARFYDLADKIETSYGAIDADGNVIDYAKLQKEGENYWMPKTYTFDDNSIIIKAGDKIPETTIQKLYWASKEVESQFFRVNGNDKPLEPNNTDKVLTIKLFNNPSEYELNWYINGMKTNNGGMYVEPQGTFYTFDRKWPEENRYSLEELFRHEYTHYLQGKYQVPGMWGTGDFYKDGDLEWFDEATAEFFAGSTRTENVKPRQAIAQYLVEDTNPRFTLDKLFKSGYNSGEWMFYNYGWACASYLYNTDIESLMKLNDAIKNYKIEEFRNILKSLASNKATEAAYQSCVQNYVNNVSSLGTPLVGKAYTESHVKRSLDEIKKDLASVSGINNLKDSITTSQFFKTFKFEGVYSGGATKGRVADWKEMNAKANEMLAQLSAKGWDGYDTVTCYFTDYKVENGIYQYNLVFRGQFNGDSSVVTPENQAPVAVINANNVANVNESIAFKGENSTDADGSISSYQWNFGDGSTSTAVNPTHSYVDAGIYDVTLKVTDDKGKVSETTIKISVKKEEKPTTGNNLTEEVEPNDSYTEAEANLFIGNNTEVKAIMSSIYDNDIYAFEVDKAGKVNINLTRSNSNLTWVIYKATDTRTYRCWVQNTKDNLTTGSFNAEVGKYYLVVYPTSTINNANYSILIDGIKSYSTSTPGEKPEEDSKIVYEQENNDKVADNIVAIANGGQGKGVLSQGGDTDIFAFDVNTSGTMNINVDSDQGQYTWVVFKKDRENNFVCWSQYSTETGTKGSFQATEGRYYIKLYSLNDSQVEYTIKLNN